MFILQPTKPSLVSHCSCLGKAGTLVDGCRAEGFPSPYLICIRTPTVSLPVALSYIFPCRTVAPLLCP